MEIGLHLGVVDTIYEEEEEEMEAMSGSSDEDSGCSSSSWIVFENPTSQAASLQSSIHSWSEATGLPTSVTVHIEDQKYHLHKFPLVSKSGYFKKKLMEANEIYIHCPPGGAEVFELIAVHCYGSIIPMGPSTIVAIICAAEFFEMTEAYHKGNLCKQSHRYFKEIIFRHWDYAIEALKSCQELYPMAQDLNIDSSCVEAISLLIFFKIEKNTPVLFPLANMNLTVKCGHMESLIEDLVTLPLEYFSGIMEFIKEKGVHAKFISRALFLYADRWVFDVVNSQGINIKQEKDYEMKKVVECITRLLPEDKDVLSLTFLFGLLRCALAWNTEEECTFKLEKRSAAHMEQATIADFLLPMKNEKDEMEDLGILEIVSMQHIVSLFMSQQADVCDESDYTLFSERTSSHSSSSSNPFACNVGKVWDEYLTEIATYSNVSPSMFLDLMRTVPSSSRSVHDQLYKAIHIYLTTHPQISDTDKTNICSILNCQKLSQDIRFHAIQNEWMPLRMIVQAMYMHQLQGMCNPPQPSRARSFRSYLDLNPNNNHNDKIRSVKKADNSLGSILERDRIIRETAYLKSNLQETSSLVESLQEEIKVLREQINGSFRKDASTSTTEMPAAEEFSKRLETMSCSKKSSWADYKGCGGGGIAQRLIKSFQKLRLGGITKSKLKHTSKGGTSTKSVQGGYRDKNSGAEVDVEEGLDMYDDDELDYPRWNISSCRDIDFVVDESKIGSTRIHHHERSHSLS